MTTFNRWNHEPDVVPHGEEFLASSEAFPGVYGEGTTREEAIDNFWQMVDFIGDLARAPDWPHDRSPYVDEWEKPGDEAPLGEDDDEFPPWKPEDGGDDVPPWTGEPWKPD